jgi:DNA-binding GntR family transcriptional regulator
MRTIISIRQAALEREDLAKDSGSSIYERLRDDIIHGRVKPNERLKVAELASRMGTSTNPVREALQQLRGEGFVVMTPNRGARVRPIDEDFVRDICEIEVLIEPALTRWFVGIVTMAEIVITIAMRSICGRATDRSSGRSAVASLPRSVGSRPCWRSIES